MIHFFRNIRHNLLEKNNFRKYLTYTIGEVIIVIIGILIAIQINNWNEDRKDRKDELYYISKIKSIGWEPKTGLKEGIKATYAWYIAQQLKAQLQKGITTTGPDVPVSRTPCSVTDSLRGNGGE